MPAGGTLQAKPPQDLLGGGMGLDLAGAGRERCVCRDTALGFPLSGVPIPPGSRKSQKQPLTWLLCRAVLGRSPGHQL